MENTCPHAEEDRLVPGMFPLLCLNCSFNGGDLFCFLMIGFSALFILGQMIRAHAFFSTLVGLIAQ